MQSYIGAADKAAQGKGSLRSLPRRGFGTKASAKLTRGSAHSWNKICAQKSLTFSLIDIVVLPSVLLLFTGLDVFCALGLLKIPFIRVQDLP